MKLYILVRTDIEIPVGKIMAHCVHNSVRNMKENMFYLWVRHSEWYYKSNTVTIVVDGKSVENIEAIIKKATKKVISSKFVVDAGMDEKICAAIGPLTDEEAKELGIKKLSLYK